MKIHSNHNIRILWLYNPYQVRSDLDAAENLRE